MALLADLPLELLRQIAAHLGPSQSLVNFCLVNKAYHSILNTELYQLEITQSGSLRLIHAAVEGRNDWVSLFVSHGADVNGSKQACEPPVWGNGVKSRRVPTDCTAMFAALFGAKLSTVELLITFGADVNRPCGFVGSDYDGVAPLSYAVELGFEPGSQSTVEKLLGAGADINCIATPSLVALNTAVKNGYEEMVALLLANGADPNVGKGIKGGVTPLMTAVTSQEVTKNIIEALLKAGADATEKDPYGETLLEVYDLNNAWSDGTVTSKTGIRELLRKAREDALVGAT